MDLKNKFMPIDIQLHYSAEERKFFNFNLKSNANIVSKMFVYYKILISFFFKPKRWTHLIDFIMSINRSSTILNFIGWRHDKQMYFCRNQYRQKKNIKWWIISCLSSSLLNISIAFNVSKLKISSFYILWIIKLKTGNPWHSRQTND